MIYLGKCNWLSDGFVVYMSMPASRTATCAFDAAVSNRSFGRIDRTRSLLTHGQLVELNAVRIGCTCT